MKNPLVTISIPTYYSEPFLKTCLDAIKKQSYKRIEINIVDGGSKDMTVEIARKYGVKDIILNKGSLMEARLAGVIKSKGEYILLLDSDQILEKNAIADCIDQITKNNDMVILGEDVHKQNTLLEKLFHLDRKLVHTVKDINPYTSVLLPRFYRKTLLLKAYKKVPQDVIAKATPQDHAILYLESWKLSKKIGFVKKGVRHMEPSSMLLLWKKFFRWGYFSINTEKTIYDSYFEKRTQRFRNGMFQKGLFFESFASILLLLMKGIPYSSGYYVGKIHRLLQKRI